jgi:hypothetical protein
MGLDPKKNVSPFYIHEYGDCLYAQSQARGKKNGASIEAPLQCTKRWRTGRPFPSVNLHLRCI